MMYCDLHDRNFTVGSCHECVWLIQTGANVLKCSKHSNYYHPEAATCPHCFEADNKQSGTFHVVCQISLNIFTLAVNTRLSEGWVLHGEMIYQNGKFIQALIREGSGEK